MATFEELPREILIFIALYADIGGTNTLLRTCKKFRNALFDEIWDMDVRRPQSQALCWAIGRTCHETLQRAWQKGCSFSGGSWDRSMLPIAVRYAQKSIITAILTFSSADSRKPRAYLGEALILAAALRSPPIVKCLLTVVRGHITHHMIQCLYVSAIYYGNTDNVRFFIDGGVQGYGVRALKLSTLMNHPGVVRLLLSYGFPPVAGGGNTLLDAIVSDQLLIFQMLVENSDQFRGNYSELVGYLDNCIFFRACQIASLLLANGACLDIGGHAGYQYLSAAVWRGCLEMVRLLLRFGADPEEYYTRFRALLDGVESGHRHIIRFFLERGSDLNDNRYKRGTPLHCAARLRQLDLIELFLRNGANPNGGDWKGRTPLHEAAKRSDVSAIRLLKRYGAWVDIIDQTGATALHEAARKSSRETLEELLWQGANPFRADCVGARPLHYAAWYGHEAAARCLMARFEKNEVDLMDNQHRTALFYACWQGQTSFCKLLLRRGADILQRDAHGATVFHIAIRSRNIDCINGLVIEISVDQMISLFRAIDSFGRNLDAWAQVLNDVTLGRWMATNSSYNIPRETSFRRTLAQPSMVYCTICTQPSTFEQVLKCGICNGGYYFICKECQEFEVRGCKVPGHRMTE